MTKLGPISQILFLIVLKKNLKRLLLSIQRNKKLMFFILIFLNLSKHKELCDIRKLTLTISHGQADLERVFSLNKNREIWKR